MFRKKFTGVILFFLPFLTHCDFPVYRFRESDEGWNINIHIGTRGTLPLGRNHTGAQSHRGRSHTGGAITQGHTPTGHTSTGARSHRGTLTQGHNKTWAHFHRGTITQGAHSCRGRSHTVAFARAQSHSSIHSSIHTGAVTVAFAQERSHTGAFTQGRNHTGACALTPGCNHPQGRSHNHAH